MCYEVVEADDGLSAVEVLEQAERERRPIDVALVDLKMQTMSGLPLVEIMQQGYADVRIVVMSGHPEALREAERKFSRIPTLLKPFEIETLATILEGLLPTDKSLASS